MSPSSAPLPFQCLGEGSPTKIDYRKKGSLILTSLLEDLVTVHRSTNLPISLGATSPCSPT